MWDQFSDYEKGGSGSLYTQKYDVIFVSSTGIQKVSHCYRILIDGRTYYSIYCFFTQLCMTFDIPQVIPNAEPLLSLPCSEAEWRAADPGSWYTLSNSPTAPPTPSYPQALHDLFIPTAIFIPGIRYSHFGLFIMINAICAQLWAHLKIRAAEPQITLNSIEYAIDQWQRAWSADPDCSLSATSPHGPLSFNAFTISHGECSFVLRLQSCKTEFPVSGYRSHYLDDGRICFGNRMG